jgi:hypothetical protein
LASQQAFDCAKTKITDIRRGRFWRVSDHRHDACGRRLEVDLLGNIQGIIYVNPKIPNGALEFRMAKEELHCAQVSSLAIDLGRLRIRRIECVP